ncbi:MAG: DUF4344 domain-containing metallopeptidase [Pyrinomonadaceae bacterium]
MTPKRRNLFNFLFAVAALALLVACSCPSLRDLEDGSQNRKKTSTKKKKETDDGKKKDRGDFVVEHTGVKNPAYEDIDRQFQENKVLEKAADKLNRSLILPNDITLRTKDCGEINAFYSPSDQSITFCYELMEYFFKLYKLDGSSDKEANERMNKAITFVFLHELGHGLIDNYELPITGNEEDAADRCSAYICIEELGDDGVESIVAAAEAFAIESKMSKPDRSSMADEHLLQGQRFYNSLCMIYGSDPEKYAGLAEKGLLPQDRARRCPTEYERTARSWQELLKPWRKD